MAQYFLQVFRVYSVEDVKKVVPGRTLADGILVGEVLGELRVFVKHGPQVLDRKLVVVRDPDCLHLRLFEKHFLATKNFLEEVFVDDILLRQVILHCKTVKNK